MQVPLPEAEGRLTELVLRAEAGDEIVLTRDGSPAARIVPILARPTDAERKALLDALHGAGRRDFGPDAAHASDFLYDDDGLPA